MAAHPVGVLVYLLRLHHRRAGLAVLPQKPGGERAEVHGLMMEDYVVWSVFKILDTGAYNVKRYGKWHSVSVHRRVWE